ncbi:MAG: GNAT family N-acetyltransferase [Hyphomonadaceae bacterium]
MSHVLDKPIWSALETRQAAFRSDDGIARRFPVDVSPFVAARDGSPEAVAGLLKLIPNGDDVSFLEVAPPKAPAGVTGTEAMCFQMTVTAFARTARDVGAQPLGEEDAAEMLELALLTRPGPFRKRTHTLGRFIGVHEGGKLVAMAGERLCVPGYREISAVCTRPDWQGRGLGGALLQQVGERIMREGDTPFLHTYTHNAPAVALYTKLGFGVRAEIVHAVWRRV